ncbi:hypothetical protein JHK86_039946 [Glycine max]|nr:hypothetical protein JHK86_039946 [Glycine max]
MSVRVALNLARGVLRGRRGSMALTGVGQIGRLPQDDCPPFFYVYRYMFEVLNLTLPLNTFQCARLRHLNVAPSQFHPNSWTMVRAFEIGHARDYVSPPPLSFLSLLPGKEVSLKLESTFLELLKLVRIKLSRLHPTCFHFWQPRGSVKGLGGLVSIRSPRL